MMTVQHLLDLSMHSSRIQVANSGIDSASASCLNLLHVHRKLSGILDAVQIVSD